MSRSSDQHDARMHMQSLEGRLYYIENGELEVVTTPPEGMLKVKNIYYNPANNKFLFDYEDET